MHPHPIQISSLCCVVKSVGRVARDFKKSMNELGEPLSPYDLIFNDGVAMTQKETQSDKAKELPSILIPLEIATMGKKRLEEFVAIQKEQLEKLQEVNRHWIERMQSAATLASEYAAKLTAARSIPEAATAYQEWAQRHMEMAAEDGKRIVADGQKLAETGARLLSNAWRPNGHGGSA